MTKINVRMAVTGLLLLAIATGGALTAEGGAARHLASGDPEIVAPIPPPPPSPDPPNNTIWG